MRETKGFNMHTYSDQSYKHRFIYFKSVSHDILCMYCKKPHAKVQIVPVVAHVCQLRCHLRLRYKYFDKHTYT